MRENIISSKNFWYFVFAIIFVLGAAVISWRVIFKKDQPQKQAEPTRLSYLQASPSPTGKGVWQYTPTPTPEVSPNPSISPSLAATKSADVKIITKSDGTTYLSTETKTQEKYKVDQKTVRAENSLPQRSLQILPDTNLLPAGFINDFGELVTKLLKIAMLISMLLVLFHLVYGGLLWITSGGDKSKTDEARDRMINAVIGLIIVASSYAIFILVLNFLGFDNPNDLFKQINL